MAHVKPGPALGQQQHNERLLVNLAIAHAAQHSMAKIVRLRYVSFRLLSEDLNFLQKQYRKMVAEYMISEANKDRSERCFENKPKPKKTRLSRSAKDYPYARLP